ncbi:MAG TPA: lmo0937 family membrane protein [Gemmatimonadaceae bacterium]
MLETIIIILVILWALGMIGGYTMGGLIHILLIVALIVLILRLVRGRPAL